MPDYDETQKARKDIGHAQDSVKGFVDAFTAVRAHRGAGQGAPTDEDQDLARAALGSVGKRYEHMRRRYL